MAPPKRKSGGRTTPKGTKPGQVPRSMQGRHTAEPQRLVNPDHDARGVNASSRYTPPVPVEMRVSPQWVPVLMFTLFIVGALIILLYYLEFLPGGPSNWFLLAGLLAILGGLYTATKYR